MYNIVNYNKPNNVFDIVDSFFNDFYSPICHSVKERKYAPLVDIYENENDFFVEAQLPGMKKEDIKIEIDQGKLFVSGESCKENEIKKENYYKKEIIEGKFFRSFILPKNIDKDKLNASFKDGILKIRLPKIEEAKPKQIKIN